MPALDWITIKGFKSIKSIERLQFGPLNLLIGPNGAGKSNLIEAFSLLQAMREGKLQEYVARAGGASRLLHFGADQTRELRLEVSFANETNQYAIHLVPTSADSLFPSREHVGYWQKWTYPEPYEQALVPNQREAGISSSHMGSVATYVQDRLSRLRIYHFHDTSSTSAMKQTADIDDNRFLRPDGSNLASFLYLLRTKHRAQYNEIRSTVQLVAPFFEDFELNPRELNPSQIRLEWKHKGSSAYFDASSMSDGTLRFALLATLFLQPSSYKPSVILVDEPELGLHPYAVNVLASLMRQASVENQVLASTQSTLLLDSFKPDDVLVANRVDGGTTVSRLSDDALGEWLNEYSLGQLWEKNEIGGRPSVG